MSSITAKDYSDIYRLGRADERAEIEKLIIMKLTDLPKSQPVEVALIQGVILTELLVLIRTSKEAANE